MSNIEKPINQQGSSLEDARKQIRQIWFRARMNAFAHKSARIDYAKREDKNFITSIIFSFLSIFSIILLYLFSSSDNSTLEIINNKIVKTNLNSSWLVLTLITLSILFTLIALTLRIISNNRKLGLKSAEHKFFMNSYQHIAQRAREAKWEGRTYDKVIELLNDIERDFQLLKARGEEPLDKHYDEAKQWYLKIKNDKDISIAQSFSVNINYKTKEKVEKEPSNKDEG